jgi:hypothetical protein
MFHIQDIKEIVSGGAIGVDKEGEHFASHMDLPIKRFLPDWDKYGKGAGPIRNKEMAQYGDVLLLIWNGDSHGSKSMEREMKKLNKPVYEIILLSPDTDYDEPAIY